MEIFKITLTSLGSITVLFVLTKIIGNREMSQLSMFDYINSITIGSIAAEMAISSEKEFVKPLVAMVVYSAVILLFSYISLKSIFLRKILTGKSLTLLQDGKLIESNFKKAKLDINEFLTQCRTAGYYNIGDLQTAVLETNGRISFLPLSVKRPVNPSDLSLLPEMEKPTIAVIIDGKIINENLQATGNDDKWLDNELKNQGVSKISYIFLGICDTNNNLRIYLKEILH